MGWAKLPTPVQCVPWPDSNHALWVKRDDLSHDRYGGGKVRKLEWLLASPKWKAGPILSVGAIGSHHLLALAEMLSLQGRQLHALVFPQVATSHALGNFYRLVQLGTRIIAMNRRLSLPLHWLRHRYFPDGEVCSTYLAAGGSDDVGLLAFVEAGLELAEQVARHECPSPRRIYVAAGTAGTVAGLTVGFALAGLRTQICAVSSVERLAFNRWMLMRQVRRCTSVLDRFGLHPSHRAALKSGRLRQTVNVGITHAQVGPGYGVPTARAKAALNDAGQVGLNLELTYTGKVWAEMMRRESKTREPVLFWNTHAAQEFVAPSHEDWIEALEPKLRAWMRARVLPSAPS